MSRPSTADRLSSRLYYGWVVVGVTFFTLLVAAGVRSAPAVLIVPLEREFGWSRAEIALPISVGLLLYGLIGPFSAGFVERFGLRAVMLTALALFGAGFGLTPLAGSTTTLLSLWGLMCLAAALTVLWVTAPPRPVFAEAAG
jgi:fucose permease